MVLSTRRGVGIHGVAPAGVTTCLRPPWWRSVIGMSNDKKANELYETTCDLLKVYHREIQPIDPKVLVAK
jgi:hypothetical protein